MDRRTVILLAITPDESAHAADHSDGMDRIGRHLISWYDTGAATSHSMPDADTASEVMRVLMDGE